MQAPSEVLSAGGRTSVSSTSQFRDRYAISKIYHIDFSPLGLISTSSLHSILHGVFFHLFNFLYCPVFIPAHSSLEHVESTGKDTQENTDNSVLDM